MRPLEMQTLAAPRERTLNDYLAALDWQKRFRLDGQPSNSCSYRASHAATHVRPAHASPACRCCTSRSRRSRSKKRSETYWMPE